MHRGLAILLGALVVGIAVTCALLYLAATDTSCIGVCARGDANEIVARECPCIGR